MQLGLFGQSSNYERNYLHNSVRSKQRGRNQHRAKQQRPINDHLVRGIRMTHDQIVQLLTDKGFDEGWVVSDTELIVWEHDQDPPAPLTRPK